MSKGIIQKTAQIWNERFEKKLKESNLTQRDFIQKYHEKFGTGSQSDVSNWMHVGNRGGKTNKLRNFPEFKTMKQIAEVLGVSVSYLIGESDYESFEEEQVAKYLKLSPKAIRSICGITSGKAIPPFYKYPDAQVTSALEALLSCESLVKYLKKIYAFADAYVTAENPRSHYYEAFAKIPANMQEDVGALWDDAEDAIEKKGIVASDELWSYIDRLEEAAQKDMEQCDVAEREINAIRYAIQEISSHLIDEACQNIKINTGEK